MAAGSASRRDLLATLAATVSCASWAGAEPGQVAGFPRHAVRVVVPYSVGVGPDVVARGLAEQLSRRWGQPVLVDNRPGASGILAFGNVRQTPPDGHTLYLADTATLAINPLLHASLPYDASKDLVPLTLLFRATFVLWTGEASRFNGIGALLEAARAAPGRISYASLGNGHASHVAIETLARAAQVQMLHLPFKDAGALMLAVANAQVDFTAFGMNTVAGLASSGRLRPLAVAASQRLPSHPQIPTLAEAGGPPVEMHPWAALMAVAGTPVPVLDQLQRDLIAALDSHELRQRADQAGFEITPSTPQALRDRIAADIALYGPLVREGRVARF